VENVARAARTGEMPEGFTPEQVERFAANPAAKRVLSMLHGVQGGKFGVSIQRARHLILAASRRAGSRSCWKSNIGNVGSLGPNYY